MSRYKFGKLMLNNNNKKKIYVALWLKFICGLFLVLGFLTLLSIWKKKKKLIYPNFSTKLNFLPQVVVHCKGRKKNNLKKKRYRT